SRVYVRIVVRIQFRNIHFEYSGSVIHRPANKPGKGQNGHVIGFRTAKSLKFGSSGRLVTYQVRIGSGYSRWANRLVSIDHNFIFGCFFYSILIMIYNPLAVMVFASGQNIAYITTFYSIIAVVNHKLISFVKMSFVVANR